jgi:uncharacterized membrane protein YphA (DoxX/SURF4 family)
MIYRLDYLLAVIFTGGFLGAILAPRTSSIPPGRLASGFYALIGACTVLAGIFFTCIVVSDKTIWNTFGDGVSDVSNLLLGGLLGLAMLRPKRWDLLRERDVYSALCLLVAISFMTFGLDKAFHMEEATQFFLRSGYPTAFLKFIVIAEVLGGAGLLITWTRGLAIAGLGIDVFGAIYTHVHNGDSIHDAKDAFAMVIALGTIAFAWAFQPGGNISTHQTRRRVIGVAASIVVCAFLAGLGATLVRHSSHGSHERVSKQARENCQNPALTHRPKTLSVSIAFPASSIPSLR